MAEAKHTKGPWTVETFVDNRPQGSDHHTYKITPQRGVYGSMFEADARLAAAAPDLLEALQSLKPIVEEIHAKWDEGMKAGKLLIALMDPSLNYRADITAIHAAIAKATGSQA